MSYSKAFYKAFTFGETVRGCDIHVFKSKVAPLTR